MMEMETFAGLPYSRPDFNEIKREFKELTRQLEEAESFEAFVKAFEAIEAARCALETQYSTAYIRNTMNTADPYYEDEINYFDKNLPALMGVEKKLTETLLGSVWRPQFEQTYGSILFDTAEADERIQSKKIIVDLANENTLKTKYNKIAASCVTEFAGEKCNFYGLLRHMQSPDRAVRRAAFEAWAGLYEGASAELDNVFDELVAQRVRIAKKLELPSYTEYGYLSMHRLDYGPADVEAFRNQIVENVVPVCRKIFENQAARLGVDKLRFYDESLIFPEGNPVPSGTAGYMLGCAKDMYEHLSGETGEFFNFMLEHRLFDLETRPGKHLGGYCTALPSYKAPFIFSNFNGTSADVDVLTHECGHAFQYYLASRELPFQSICSSTSEVNEIHSMTMELFTYPWMNRFFGEDAARYRYAHLCEALTTIPYLVCVDEFQHVVYARPELGAQGRRRVWRELEQKYMPWRDYDGNAFLEGGGFWMQKQHIFLYPFYYIDYALAQICAFELCGRMKKDFDAAWRDYLSLCRLGGSQGYRQLLASANLVCPFENGAVLKAITPIVREIASYE